MGLLVANQSTDDDDFFVVYQNCCINGPFVGDEIGAARGAAVRGGLPKAEQRVGGSDIYQYFLNPDESRIYPV